MSDDIYYFIFACMPQCTWIAFKIRKYFKNHRTGFRICCYNDSWWGLAGRAIGEIFWAPGFSKSFQNEFQHWHHLGRLKMDISSTSVYVRPRVAVIKRSLWMAWDSWLGWTDWPWRVLTRWSSWDGGSCECSHLLQLLLRALLSQQGRN